MRAHDVRFHCFARTDPSGTADRETNATLVLARSRPGGESGRRRRCRLPRNLQWTFRRGFVRPVFQHGLIRRRLPRASVAFVLLAGMAAYPSAQEQPDFSGRWVLVSEPPTADTPRVIGRADSRKNKPKRRAGTALLQGNHHNTRARERRSVGDVRNRYHRRLGVRNSRTRDGRCSHGLPNDMGRT